MGNMFGVVVAIRPDVDRINPYVLAGRRWFPKHMEVVCEFPPNVPKFCW